ncbi:NAD-dependent epimerase/dehydratase family protein [Moraxella nasicaprae]|uniref:NAD-dependent epimerase/dehydratase family protein n=1 Tax=Moraxella nasicaprae TaxID=2904122 RepID=A0ABY6F5B4_9GAMM|nr:NAD-dependent epimerase/dehydratase family protein [Moraxella nasicaprae]UXZ05239.1 NAD-dependent epimerase/dehydratase family protein [Moraxella nasicaprae]
MNTMMIIGQGAIGQPLAEKLAVSHKVIGVARSPKFYQQRVQFLQKDARQLNIDDLAMVTHIAIIITPSERSVAGYQESYLAICQRLAMLAKDNPTLINRLQQVLFLSSTAVYGENQGEMIDEHTPAIASSATAQVLLDAEEVLKDGFGDKAVIVRASGIYGKTRLRMLRQAATAHQDGVPSHQYTNRIMDTDLIQVLACILTQNTPKSLYLATDFDPVEASVVMRYLADLLHYPKPNVIESLPSGKRIISNINPDWLDFPTHQAGYAWIVSKIMK